MTLAYRMKGGIILRDWSFENEIEVYEEAYDSDLHCLKVYSGEKFLGTVYPSSIEDMQQLFEELDAGNDPVSSGWEDGLGNTCTLAGWGSEKSEQTRVQTAETESGSVSEAYDYDEMSL